MPRFRIRTKAFFLTFSRSPHPVLRDFYEHLLRKNDTLVAGVGVLESHEDGAPHWHFAVRYSDTIDVNDPRYFDWNGSHCQIQACRSWKKTIRYFRKEANPEFFGEQQTNPQKNQSETPDLAMHAKDAEHQLHYMQWAFANKVPYSYATYCWNAVRGSRAKTYNDGDEIPGHISLPELQFRLFDLEEPRSLVLVGPTGCGKTTWALRNAPKPALFVSHLDDLKELTRDHKSVIFDDMEFSHLPRATQIYLVDREKQRQIHCRYGNATIREGLHRIFTCNEYPLLDHPAINRRVYRIDLY